MKIVFLPIDNRPVCYQMPEMIGEIYKNCEIVLPDREFLGGLDKIADISNLFEWLKSKSKSADYIILSLDTIAYGGLIPSRRSKETLEEIFLRQNNLKNILKNTNAKIFAFSSIMRISNNNINQEEKEYWNLYGEKIFKYSYDTCKYGKADTDVPKEILDDYINTRKRNFEVNKKYLEWQKEGILDTLIFSKDDCAEYGFNVKEAEDLEKLGGYTKTGADEIPLTLLAGTISKKIKVYPEFLEPKYKHLISNYEDVSIEKSVLGQLELAGCEIVNKEDADVILLINNFIDKQGEIVMKRSTELFNGDLLLPDKPYIIADVRLANGADNNLVKQIFKHPADERFLGYAGWNTSANTLGSLICGMKFSYLAKSENSFDIKAFKNFEAVRLLDDWAYQANVRQELNATDIKLTAEKMLPYENLIKQFLNTEFNTRYSFPWERLFEVEIDIN